MRDFASKHINLKLTWVTDAVNAEIYNILMLDLYKLAVIDQSINFSFNYKASDFHFQAIASYLCKLSKYDLINSCTT